MRTIGRKDRVDLPELGLVNIDCKIDTGAYGNALHCHYIKKKTVDGVESIVFKVLDPSHDLYKKKVFTFHQFSRKKVKSSSGETENRYAIKTTMVIFGKKRLVEFSLTDRKQMKTPILIGRKFLTRRFLVDVDQKDLSYQHKLQAK